MRGAGTSGGPLLADISPTTGPGAAIGVIGGYQEGGRTDAISYAARFGPDITALYQAAIAGLSPNVPERVIAGPAR